MFITGSLGKVFSDINFLFNISTLCIRKRKREIINKNIFTFLYGTSDLK